MTTELESEWESICRNYSCGLLDALVRIHGEDGLAFALGQEKGVVPNSWGLLESLLQLDDSGNEMEFLMVARELALVLGQKRREVPNSLRGLIESIDSEVLACLGGLLRAHAGYTSDFLLRAQRMAEMIGHKDLVHELQNRILKREKQWTDEPGDPDDD